MKNKGIDIPIPTTLYRRICSFVLREGFVLGLSIVMAVLATAYFYVQDQIVSYSDAESHLNIAKRVVHSITPGVAQLGGIWLPLPHVLMIPLVYIEPLYRTGLAGSIVSGISFVLSCLYLYRTVVLITHKKWVALLASVLFIFNPNVLYLQSTPMSELLLMMFFIISVYYFLRFLYEQHVVFYLVLAALFGFCATLSRYDGWFLVLVQAFCLMIIYGRKKAEWVRLEGYLFLFSTLAFFGVVMWLLWGYLILGDPLYFANSSYSAKSQQNEWNARGELPAYHDPVASVLYYTFTSLSNVGVVVFFAALIGFILYVTNKQNNHRLIVAILFLVPYMFYIITLFLGQSIIFIPSLTPRSFQWQLFNVRYGVMMVPFAATFTAYLFSRLRTTGRSLLTGLLVVQIGLYLVGYSRVVTLDDGLSGSSHAPRPEAERWMRANYDGGLVLMDDYARRVSVVRSDIPMQKLIYVGNKPYWEESLVSPEKHATWIVIQKDDAVWTALLENTEVRNRLFIHFDKVYDSDNVLIFKRQIDEK